MRGGRRGTDVAGRTSQGGRARRARGRGRGARRRRAADEQRRGEVGEMGRGSRHTPRRSRVPTADAAAGCRLRPRLLLACSTAIPATRASHGASVAARMTSTRRLHQPPVRSRQDFFPRAATAASTTFRTACARPHPPAHSVHPARYVLRLLPLPPLMSTFSHTIHDSVRGPSRLCGLFRFCNPDPLPLLPCVCRTTLMLTTFRSVRARRQVAMVNP